MPVPIHERELYHGSISQFHHVTERGEDIMDETPYEHSERNVRHGDADFWAISRGPAIYDREREHHVIEE